MNWKKDTAYAYIHGALVEAMKSRDKVEDWVVNERIAMAVAANDWAAAHDLDRRISVADIERIEHRAMGHVDYSTKMPLYVAELLLEDENGD